jgi:hypothetical protein
MESVKLLSCGGLNKMTRLGFIIVIILATGIIFYTGVGVEKSKGPWKFLHCTSTNNDCGRLE